MKVFKCTPATELIGCQVILILNNVSVIINKHISRLLINDGNVRRQWAPFIFQCHISDAHKTNKFTKQKCRQPVTNQHPPLPTIDLRNKKKKKRIQYPFYLVRASTHINCVRERGQRRSTQVTRSKRRRNLAKQIN